jgi:hypothetical protein
MLAAAVFAVRYVGVNLSLSSVALGLILLFHGPAYLYYTRVWGPDSDFFHQILSAAPGQPVIQNLDIAIGCLFVFLCIGIRFADVCWATNSGRMRQSIAEWGKQQPGVSPIETSRLWMWLTAIGLFVLLPFVFIDNQLSAVTNYFSLDLSGQEKIELRHESGGSAYYLYNLVVATFATFLAFCVVAARALAGKKWTLPAITFIGLLAVAKMALLSKAPIAVFIIQLAVVRLLSKSLQIDFGAVAGTTAIAVVGFSAMAVVAIPSLDGVGLIFEFLFYRIFMIVNEGLLEYFSAIPYVIDFSWGAKMGWVAALFQNDAGLPNYWLVSEVHRGVLGSTTTVLFLGDAWADWAWFGVIAFPFGMGFLLRSLDISLIARRGKSIATIGALALGQFGIFIALSTALQTALLTGGLLLALPFCYLIGTHRYKQD